MKHHQKNQQSPARIWPQNYSAGPWQWDEGRHWLNPVIKSPDTSAVHTILELDTSAWGYAFSKHEDVRREDDANLQLIEKAPLLANALLIAERFMAGFEGDEQQSIDIELSIIRDALTQALGDPSPKV